MLLMGQVPVDPLLQGGILRHRVGSMPGLVDGSCFFHNKKEKGSRFRNCPLNLCHCFFFLSFFGFPFLDHFLQQVGHFFKYRIQAFAGTGGDEGNMIAAGSQEADGIHTHTYAGAAGHTCIAGCSPGGPG